MNPSTHPHAPTAPLAQARALIVLGLPLIGSHLAQFGLHVTDTIMLGWYGVLPLAAGVLGSSTFFVLFILGSGFAKAVLPLVAAAHAQGDETTLRRVTRMALWLSALFGLVIGPVFWWSEALLLLLGQKPDVAALAADYLTITWAGLVPALWVMVLKSHLAAMGRTQVVLWVTVAAVFVNAALNWALIFGNWGAPELGVTGSAIATTLVNLFTVVILCLYAALLPALRRQELFRRFWRPDWGSFGQVFRLGWPMGLTGLAESGLFQASALMMGWIGTVELAAHGIALEVAALTFMLHVGLSSAATIRIARFDGQGDRVQVRRAAKVAVVISLAVAIASVCLFVAVPEPIVALFLDLEKPESAAILAYGSALLVLAALFQLADGMQVMALGLLRGIQDTQVPMVLAAVSYWLIGIPCSYVLAFKLGYGGQGLWLGLVVGLFCAAASLMWRFWRLAR